jgi:hypothetical protein
MPTQRGQRSRPTLMTQKDDSQRCLGGFCPLAEATAGISLSSARTDTRHRAGTAIFAPTRTARGRCKIRASPSGPVLVHFPHRGLEHKPPRGVQRYSWSTKRNHARKFLRSPGRYVTPGRSPVEALLAFWGEWEAPSHVRKCWREDGELPRFLHEPVWEYPIINGFRARRDLAHCRNPAGFGADPKQLARRVVYRVADRRRAAVDDLPSAARPLGAR